MIYTHIKNNQKAILYFIALFCFSLILLLVGEWQTVGSLWMVIICLIPSMWIAFQSSYLSLKIICATTLITQIITVPVFYLQADRYAFGVHRPFGFTVLDALPVFLILGAFLFLLASVVKLSESLIGSPIKWSDNFTQTGMVGQDKKLITGRTKSQILFILGILVLIAISLPVKFWMFDMGIGIVGAPPPKLPFRLSGILFYLFSYIVPLSIGYLYIKTKRSSLLLAVFISLYALLIGLTSSSKGVVLLINAPIVAFAWLDRRWVILTLSSILASLGVMIAAASREIVHISDGLTTGSFTELGAFGTLTETLFLLKWTPEMFLILAEIAGRVEGFQGLLLASQFNPDAVGGAWGILQKSISHGWVDLDHDAMHLEYLGYTIPYGFYGVAASLNAWMLMATNQSLFMLFFFVIYAALVVIILEKMLKFAAYKYKLPLPIAQSVLFFATLWFYTGPGTYEFRTVFVVSIIFGLLPAFRIGHLYRPVPLLK